MKKVIGLGIAIFIVAVSYGLANAQYDAIADEQREAGLVLESFLNAQRDGRTAMVKECLGGDLLQKRSQLLDNPEYAEFLRNAYKDTIFEIVNYESLTKESMQIDVKFDSSDQESKQIRYLLIKKSTAPNYSPRFLIYSQTELTQ
jgi:hypothetical protein